VGPGANFSGTIGEGTGINHWATNYTTASGYDDNFDLGGSDGAKREWLLRLTGVQFKLGNDFPSNAFTVCVYLRGNGSAPNIAVQQIQDPNSLGAAYPTGWLAAAGGYAFAGGATKAFRTSLCR